MHAVVGKTGRAFAHEAPELDGGALLQGNIIVKFREEWL